MSVQAAQLQAQVQVTGVDQAKSQLGDMGKAVDSTSGGFGNLLKQGLGMAAGFAIFDVGTKAVGFLKDQLFSTIQVAMQHQDVMTQTAQVIKSTGDASGMTAQSIGDLALSLSKTTDFSDDTTQAAENMLLTFTNIGKTVFPDATKTALDMAQALKEGPTQASMMLGKALDDPTKGITALTRVGVTFTDQQKSQIKAMQDAGNMAGAQGIILKELQKEFGGSAEAAGKTFGGQLQILKNNLEDVKQKIGTALLPILGQFTGWVSSTAMPLLDRFGGWFTGTAVPAIQNFGSTVGNIFTYVGNIFRSLPISDLTDAWNSLKSSVRETTQIVGMFADKLKPVSADVDPIADTIGALAHDGMEVLANAVWKAYTGLSAFNGVFTGGKGPLTDFANGIKQLGPPLQNIGNLLKGEMSKEFNDLGKDAQQVGQWFMTSVVPAFKQALPGFENLGKTILTTVIPAFIQIRGVVVDVIQHAFEKFAPIIEKIVPPLIKFAGVLANDIANGLKFIMPYVLQAAKAIGDFAEGIMDRVVPIINNAIGFITPTIQGLFKVWNIIWPGMQMILQGVFNEIRGVIQIAWSIITGLFNISLDVLSGNWSGAWKDMQNMLGGVWDGIKTLVSGGIQVMLGILTGIGGLVNTYLVKPFEDALGSIGGVFSAIGKLVTDASTLNFGAIPGDLHSLGIPGFASGTSYAPGGWAMVGEQGPEAMYVPRGSQIVPNSQLGSMGSSQGGGQPVVINVHVAGHNVAQAILPDFTNAVRYGVGGLGM